MCKTRLPVMVQETRKAFVNILTSLIEKSPDSKLLKIITKIVEDWVKSKVSYERSKVSCRGQRSPYKAYDSC